jgi:hypothetical protein
MCIFCTGAFARFAARFQPAAPEPTPLGKKSEPVGRSDEAARPLSSQHGQNDAGDAAQNSDDLLNR